MPTVAFNICCPRDCVFRHNGGTAGAPLKPLRVDSALRALSSLRGLRGAPEVPPLCRETQSLGQQMLNVTMGINGLTMRCVYVTVCMYVYIYIYKYWCLVVWGISCCNHSLFFRLSFLAIFILYVKFACIEGQRGELIRKRREIEIISQFVSRYNNNLEFIDSTGLYYIIFEYNMCDIISCLCANIIWYKPVESINSMYTWYLVVH